MDINGKQEDGQGGHSFFSWPPISGHLITVVDFEVHVPLPHQGLALLLLGCQVRSQLS